MIPLLSRRLLLSLFLLPACAAPQTILDPQLDAFIAAERSQKNVPLIGIALIDDQRIVYSRLHGANTPLFRAGSVSKLFTGIAIMQQVEQGKLDLDAPISHYLPDFRPTNPFSTPITLRSLMSHRSGLVREPPVGHYFDSAPPSLAATVASLNQTTLLHAPGTRTKYSNAGIAVVGYVLQTLLNKPFEEILTSNVLQPLGMRHSAFALSPNLRSLLSPASMWTYGGRHFPAPQFEFGIAPAASLYTTLDDLARFAQSLHQNGRSLLKPETLFQMFQPQFGGSFGLGFSLSQFEGQLAVQHNGAVYGFATEFITLPGEKLTAIVFANLDSANTLTARIAHQALHWMREARAFQPLSPPPPITSLTPEEVQRYAGIYGTGPKRIQLLPRDSQLFYIPARGGPRLALRRLGDDLVTDDLHGFGLRLRLRPNGLQDGPTLLARQPNRKPLPCPPSLRPYIGEYGWDHNVLYILERDGQLFALIEWFDYFPLTPVRPGVFRFPDWGLYPNETLTFSPQGASLNGLLFPKRSIAEALSVTPSQPISVLRQNALQSQPPTESGDFLPSSLTDLQPLDPSLRFDIRYAASTNFLRTPVYSQARAFLQRPAAAALHKAHLRLKSQGYGLLIHDAYRPWFVTKIFWDATPPEKHDFVADPSKGSRHNRGAAVDLTLYHLATNQPAEMPGEYDEMSERSFPDYPGGTSLARWHRELLREAMEGNSFRVFDFEWWHFDFHDWKRYPIGNVPFEAIPATR